MNLSKRIFLLITLATLVCDISYSQKIIKLTKVNGVYTIPCLVNGIPMNFIFDTGASEVSISLAEAIFLYKQGLLADEDIKEDIKYKLANGQVEEGTKINLKKITIDGLIMENVEASIVHNLNAPLLFGLNAISQLGKVVIEGDKLFVYPKRIEQVENAEAFIIDSTFKSNVQQIFLTLFQTLKTKDSKAFYSQYDHLFYFPYSISLKSLDTTFMGFNDLLEFGIKHNLDWAQIKTNNIKITIDSNWGVIIKFWYNDIEYVMESKFYSNSYSTEKILWFPIDFSTINIYNYNSAVKKNNAAYNNNEISLKEFHYKSVENAEWYHKLFTKTDTQFFGEFGVSDLADIHLYRVEYLISDEKDYIGAIQDCNRIIELLTSGLTLGNAYFFRGLCKYMLGDHKSAIIDFNKNTVLSPNLTYFLGYRNVYFFRASAKYSLKNYVGAIDDYNKAIEVDPKDYEAYFNRGLIKYSYLNNTKEGCLDMSKAGELGSKDAYEFIKDYCQ